MNLTDLFSVDETLGLAIRTKNKVLISGLNDCSGLG